MASIQKDKSFAAPEIIAWILVFAWAILIFFLSSKANSEYLFGTDVIAVFRRWLRDTLSGIAGFRVDVSPIAHFIEYFIASGLLVNALRYRFKPTKAALATVVLVAFYAFTDELHQYFVPGRSCDPKDWLVDVLAGCIAALIGWQIMRRKQAQLSPPSQAKD